METVDVEIVDVETVGMETADAEVVPTSDRRAVATEIPMSQEGAAWHVVFHFLGACCMQPRHTFAAPALKNDDR